MFKQANNIKTKEKVLNSNLDLNFLESALNGTGETLVYLSPHLFWARAKWISYYRFTPLLRHLSLCHPNLFCICVFHSQSLG